MLVSFVLMNYKDIKLKGNVIADMKYMILPGLRNGTLFLSFDTSFPPSDFVTTK